MKHLAWKCFFVEYGEYCRSYRYLAMQIGFVKDLLHTPTYSVGIAFEVGKRALAFGICWGNKKKWKEPR